VVAERLLRVWSRAPQNIDAESLSYVRRPDFLDRAGARRGPRVAPWGRPGLGEVAPFNPALTAPECEVGRHTRRHQGHNGAF
jgi:hypothetical protein